MQRLQAKNWFFFSNFSVSTTNTGLTPVSCGDRNYRPIEVYSQTGHRIKFKFDGLGTSWQVWRATNTSTKFFTSDWGVVSVSDERRSNEHPCTSPRDTIRALKTSHTHDTRSWERLQSVLSLKLSLIRLVIRCAVCQSQYKEHVLLVRTAYSHKQVSSLSPESEMN